eukprot:Hpha_TRINITY_DN15506_c7_g5::TRINITY_DN15506_c7_g5_i3::g.105756::m.105756
MVQDGTPFPFVGGFVRGMGNGAGKVDESVRGAAYSVDAEEPPEPEPLEVEWRVTVAGLTVQGTMGVMRSRRFGVVCEHVKEEAEEAGVQEGMVLCRLGERYVESWEDAQEAWQDAPRLSTLAAIFKDTESAMEGRGERVAIARVQRITRNETLRREELARLEVIAADAVRNARKRVGRAPATGRKAIFLGDEGDYRARVWELERRKRAKLSKAHALGRSLAWCRDTWKEGMEVLLHAEAAGRARLHDMDEMLEHGAKCWNSAAVIQRVWRGRRARQRYRQSQYAGMHCALIGAAVAAVAGMAANERKNQMAIRAAIGAVVCTALYSVSVVREDLLLLHTSVKSGWCGHWHRAQLYRHTLTLVHTTLLVWRINESYVAKYIGGPREADRAAVLPMPVKWVREWHGHENRDVFYPEGERHAEHAVWNLPGGRTQEQRAHTVRQCRHHKKGKCKEGNKCPNTHGMAPTPSWNPPRNGTRHVINLDADLKNIYKAAYEGLFPNWLETELPSLGKDPMAASGSRRSRGRSIASHGSPRGTTLGEGYEEKVNVGGLLDRVNRGLSPGHSLFQVQSSRGMREGGALPKGLAGFLTATADYPCSPLPDEPRGGLPVVSGAKFWPHRPESEAKKAKKKKGGPVLAEAQVGENIYDPEGKLEELGGCFCKECVLGFAVFVQKELSQFKRRNWNITEKFNMKETVLRSLGAEGMREELGKLWFEWGAHPDCPHGVPGRRISRRFVCEML